MAQLDMNPTQLIVALLGVVFKIMQGNGTIFLGILIETPRPIQAITNELDLASICVLLSLFCTQKSDFLVQLFRIGTIFCTLTVILPYRVIE